MLTQEQKLEVAKWFSEGATLDAIQKRIKADFDIHLTYLDVRLLVADLPQPVEEEVKDEKSAPADGDAEASTEAAGTTESQGVPGEVMVEVDPIAAPGVIANGSVVFSDGTKANWLIDQMGRIGMKDAPAGYRPAPADAQEFQRKLIDALRARGLM